MLLVIATIIAAPGALPDNPTPLPVPAPVVVPADATAPLPLDVPAVEDVAPVSAWTPRGAVYFLGDAGRVVLGGLLSPLGCGAQWSNCKLDSVCDADFSACEADVTGAATGPACLGQAVAAIVAGASGQVEIVIADLVACGIGLVGSSVSDCTKFLVALAGESKVADAVNAATYAAVTAALTPAAGPSLPGTAKAAAPALKVVICRTHAACGQ
jgi:hypothetical protein